MIKLNQGILIRIREKSRQIQGILYHIEDVWETFFLGGGAKCLWCEMSWSPLIQWYCKLLVAQMIMYNVAKGEYIGQ